MYNDASSLGAVGAEEDSSALSLLRINDDPFYDLLSENVIVFMSDIRRLLYRNDRDSIVTLFARIADIFTSGCSSASDTNIFIVLFECRHQIFAFYQRLVDGEDIKVMNHFFIKLIYHTAGVYYRRNGDTVALYYDKQTIIDFCIELQLNVISKSQLLNPQLLLDTFYVISNVYLEVGEVFDHISLEAMYRGIADCKAFTEMLASLLSANTALCPSAVALLTFIVNNTQPTVFKSNDYYSYASLLLFLHGGFNQRYALLQDQQFAETVRGNQELKPAQAILQIMRDMHSRQALYARSEAGMVSANTVDSCIYANQLAL